MHFLRSRLENDNLGISIQASKYHYCSPRNNEGPWDAVELGFPSKCPPTDILKWAEDEDTPTGTVYSTVPVSSLVAWLKSEGFSDDRLKRFGFDLRSMALLKDPQVDYTE